MRRDSILYTVAILIVGIFIGWKRFFGDEGRSRAIYRHYAADL